MNIPRARRFPYKPIRRRPKITIAVDDRAAIKALKDWSRLVREGGERYKNVPHDHRERVEGCFRCELSAAEQFEQAMDDLRKAAL